jgi:HlyD family secretion protein
MQSERALFESRRIARDGQRQQLRERISQLQEQVVGVAAQLKAKETELQLVQTEVAAQKELWEKNLMSIAKYTASQREAARLEGERGQLVAANAQIKARISETELQILQIDQELKSEVTKELREAQAKEAELSERKVAAEDQLMRVEIRAPQAGVVHQLGVHTLGGVIAPGEQIMQIVPESDRLVIEARIAPQDIDHVKIGAEAFLRFTAFNQRTTPEFDGVVERVSADLSKDAQTGQMFYVVRLALRHGPLKKVTGLDLVPGMPVEAHIQTGERTALSYLVKPLQDQLARTFKGQ